MKADQAILPKLNVHVTFYVWTFNLIYTMVQSQKERTEVKALILLADATFTMIQI